MMAGLTRLLDGPVQSNATYLPGARKAVAFAPELVFLLWRTIEINRVCPSGVAV
jgi:hypothetical protein